MATYESGTDLVDAIMKKGDKFIAEFEDIPEQDWDELLPEADARTPRQMLAYQLGWMSLLLDWEHSEEEGHVMHMPAPGYSWDQLDELYEMFYETWRNATPDQMIETFNEQISYLCWMITAFSQEELFEQGHRQWASSTPSAWPVWKWIHVNTVAPFTSFRMKIRRWKREMARRDVIE